jgi:hypothetical protein
MGYIALLFWFFLMPRASADLQPPLQCTAAGALVHAPGLAEASGIAASRRVPGRLYALNDSGQPVLVLLDERGVVTGEVRVSDAKVEDWEALAVAPCPTGSCVYIGDIGDNAAERRDITVYRVDEPADDSRTAAVSAVFHATYPNGAQDAETLLVAGGRLYVVTKGESGSIDVYRFPAQPKAGETVRLERVAQLSAKPDADSRITDGSVSPDGSLVVLRSRTALTFYRASELLNGRAQAASTVGLRSLREPQGEGVAFGGDGNTVFVAGESGGKGKGGTFARLRCSQAHAAPGRTPSDQR